MFRDVVEQQESKGVQVPYSIEPEVKDKPRGKHRRLGRVDPNRRVPSKYVKSMHRRTVGAQSLRQFVVELKGDDYNIGQEWFRNKKS